MELDLSSLTDRELISTALDGNPASFERLFMRYRGEILQMYLQKTGGNSHDANDMLQETFVKVYLNLHRYNPEYTFNQWVYTIARNTFVDFARKKRDNVLSIDNRTGDAVTINPPSTAPTPEQEMIITQSNNEFDAIMGTLSEQYRKMIVLRFFKEYSYEEISTELGLPLGTVKTQIHRAREKLYKLIAKSEDI